MNEIWIGTRTIIGIAGILSYSWLKMLGGRDEKELKKWHIPLKARVYKRWISPIFLALFLLIFSFMVHRFNTIYICAILFYPAETYIDGYGNNGKSVVIKTLRRLISGVLFASVSVLFAAISGKWMWFVAQTLIGAVIMVCTQFQEGEKAPSEETIIHFTRAFLIPFIL